MITIPSFKEQVGYTPNSAHMVFIVFFFLGIITYNP